MTTGEDRSVWVAMTIAVLVVLSAAMLVTTHRPDSAGLAPAVASPAATQLAGDAVYCTLWSTATGTEEGHLAVVINMTDAADDAEVRLVRTAETLDGCFTLVRGVPFAVQVTAKNIPPR